MMALVNQFNMHKLHHELNPFAGFFANPTFILIELVELAGQVLIYGGNWFRVKPIDGSHWIICIVLSLLELPVQVLIVLAKRFSDKYRLCERRNKKVSPEKNTESLVVRAVNPASEMLNGAAQAVSAMRSARRSTSNAEIVKNVTSTGRRNQEAAFLDAAKAYQGRNSSNK